MPINTSFWKDKELLLSITTLSDIWVNQINEIKTLGLKKVALFLTGLNYSQKDKAFKLIKDSPIEEIPFVHLSSIITPKEISYLMDRYKTKAFNAHSEREFPLKYDWGKYKRYIYLETLYSYPLEEDEVRNYAGVCIDISHMEIAKIRHKNVYEKNLKIIKKFGCGCNHISAYRENLKENPTDIKNTSHFYTNLSQFNYLKKYPNYFFSNMMALELDNSIEEQLKAKEYIKKLLKDKN